MKFERIPNNEKLIIICYQTHKYDTAYRIHVV